MTSLFPFSILVKVRGYELDLFGHVNNAVYLHWLEHARWEILTHGEGARLFGDTTIVVRHVELDYRAETLLGDTVRISLWPRHVGNTSFTLGACMRVVEAGSAERVGRIVLLNKTVLTCVQLHGGKVPVPPAWRALFAADDPGDVLPEGV